MENIRSQNLLFNKPLRKVSRKKISLLQATIAALAISASLPASAANPIIQSSIIKPNGTGQTESVNTLGMSLSGRYILYFDNSATLKGMYVRDIKSQTTQKIPEGNGGTTFDHYAISPNGRYVSYSNNASTGGIVYDRVTQAVTNIRVRDESRGLSNYGHVVFQDESFTPRKLMFLNTKDSSNALISDTGFLGSRDRRNTISADGRITLFSPQSISLPDVQLYNSVTNQVTAFSPVDNNGAPISINGTSTIALASSGNYLAFFPFNFNPQNPLYLATLTPSGHTLSRFDMAPKFVRAFDGLSLSSNGRFISFRGELTQGHPEYIAGQSSYRIFRYDTADDKLEAISTTFNGSPLNSSVEGTTITSDDGSMVEFVSSAKNILAQHPSNSSNQTFHAFLSNGLARNYQFIEIPNSEVLSGSSYSYAPYTPMTLVGNNIWEGIIKFDGVGSEGLKFDAGGVLVNGKFTAAADGAITFGAGSTAGQAVSSGGNIPVTSGAGTYKVMFNDQTLRYTINKQPVDGNWQRTVVLMFGETQTGQDMFIRGGLDHAKAKAILGRDCDANNALCSMPIRHLNYLNTTSGPWKMGDTKLDWQGVEAGQIASAQGSPLDWTTNIWPTSWGAKKTVAVNGYGVTPLNLWGQHYWLMDVEMDCSKTANGWFELKSFISNGPGWEGNVAQSGTPWSSNNHFAQCGKLNVFKRGQSAPVVVGGTL